jgi:hypothetical protein
MRDSFAKVAGQRNKLVVNKTKIIVKANRKGNVFLAWRKEPAIWPEVIIESWGRDDFMAPVCR